MSKSGVYILGHGITQFGEHYNHKSSSIAAKALSDARINAKIKKEEIKAVFVGSFVSNTNSQSSVGATCLRECNLSVPVTHIQGGNASGAAAFHQAFIGVKSGIYDCIAVIGVRCSDSK